MVNPREDKLFRVEDDNEPGFLYVKSYLSLMCLSHSKTRQKPPSMRVVIELLKLANHPHYIDLAGYIDFAGKH